MISLSLRRLGRVCNMGKGEQRAHRAMKLCSVSRRNFVCLSFPCWKLRAIFSLAFLIQASV